MAQYKVPQDVEADDKLIGPFSFRQFVYLLIAAGLVALCFPLFNIFPLLIILPAPFILFLLVLSLPLKKDQPMETYLSAVLSYYMKPHNRLWEPGEPESTIIITAPKKTDEVHLKDLDQDEAMHRLSFLADIVDTEGYAIKGANPNRGLREDVIAEASATKDIFETQNTAFSQQTFQQNSDVRHNELVNQMRNAIAQNNANNNASIVTHNQQPQNQFSNYASAEPAVSVAPVTPLPQYQQPMPAYQQNYQNNPAPQFVTAAMQQPYSNQQFNNQQINNQTVEQQPQTPVNPLSEESVSGNDNIIKPDLPLPESVTEQIIEEEKPQTEYIPNDIASSRIENSTSSTPSQDIIDLANNSDFSIETIAQQAKRINERQQDNEVYISLH